VASRVIDKAQYLDVNPAFDLVPRYQLARTGDGAIIPALSIPVATKSVYECPQEQQEALMDALPEVDKVLVIGWKAGEKRFLDSLAERMKKKLKIMVISSSEKKALEIAARLSSLRPTGSNTHYDVGKKGFSHSITSHEADEFLKSG